MCDCYEETIHVKELATAYVPMQNFCGVYKEKDSLERGTVFPSLDHPYKEVK